MFRAVNRPDPAISFEQMLDGLIAFGGDFHGEYWLEVFLLAGHTAIEAEVGRLAECVSLITPDRVQLNTVTRPPVDEFAVGVAPGRMDELAAMFDPPAEVIADVHSVHGRAEFSAGREDILNLLRRRPCSLDEIAEGLGMHRNEAVKFIEDLTGDRLVATSWWHGRARYRAELPSGRARRPKAAGGGS